jgi:thiosulfate/3-mercaptopyruvate sulfurtransferase
LGDPYYQILDVRSQAEYLGEAPNAGLDGRVLKLGHIPGAYNVDYRLNWVDSDTKMLKKPAELAKLYAGLDPSKAVVTYCHSGRRSSYSYYVLRVLGFEDVICYGRSWNEWGAKGKHFPVETEANPLSGSLPRLSSASGGTGSAPQGGGGQRELEQPSNSGGYISCGG